MFPSFACSVDLAVCLFVYNGDSLSLVPSSRHPTQSEILSQTEGEGEGEQNTGLKHIRKRRQRTQVASGGRDMEKQGEKK